MTGSTEQGIDPQFTPMLCRSFSYEYPAIRKDIGGFDELSLAIQIVPAAGAGRL